MKNNKAYLGHIYQSIERIEKYLGKSTFEQFCNDDMMAAATVRELEIIGEAANNLSRQFREDNSHILWRRIIDMRNFLIHEYFGVNKKIVWQTYKNDLPQLKEFVNKFLRD